MQLQKRSEGALSKEAKAVRKGEVLDKAFLIFRPGDFPLYLKPVRVMYGRKCALTGREIEAGDYAYPCYANPIRLAPGGPERCHVEAALRRGDSILPSGYYAARIPTTEALQAKGAKLDAKRRLQLASETVKLLRGAK